jgi:Spy/CpxP family protein refolding chaperone
MSRKLSITLLAVALAVGLLVVGQKSHAQQTAPDQGAMKADHPMGPMTTDDRLKMLTEKLDLTDDQQAKVRPILEDQSTQMKALRNDSSLSTEDKQAKMKELHESSMDKMNAILTPDQQTKWKQMKQDMKDKHKEMKSQDQPDHQ